MARSRTSRTGGPAGRQTRADPARKAAYDVLAAVSQRDAYANLLLPALLRDRGIQGRDAALATELTYGTLRAVGIYDAILGLCSDRPVDQLDPPVREVLRLGTHQLLATRVRSHAAVATSVDLAKDVAGMRPAGFVNAVLRRAGTRDLAEWLQIIAPDRAADPEGHLAASYGYPRWIVEVFRDALGEVPGSGLTETEQALAAGNTRPRATLAAVPGLATPAELAAGPGAAEATRWSPLGATIDGGDPAAIPAVAEGRAFVQDEASQLVALALAHAQPGPASPAGPASLASLASLRDENWLDLCAGPGGKAAVLGGLAAGRGAHLLASDARPHRARLARAHLRGLACQSPADGSAADGSAAGQGRAGQGPVGQGRAGQSPVAVITADGRRGAWRPGTFGRVLADVPCSGLGALRRRPEARWRKTPDDVAGLGALQRDLLGAAIDAARPGGVVAYVTCSPHQAETLDVVRDVTGARDDVTLLDAPELLSAVPGLPDVPDVRGADPRTVQFWPHRHGTDAIFLALLRRT